MKEQTIQRLLSLKKSIEAAKLEKAQAEGALIQNMKRLEEEFGVKTLDKAQAKLKKLKQDQEEISVEIETAIEELEKNYEWD